MRNIRRTFFTNKEAKAFMGICEDLGIESSGMEIDGGVRVTTEAIGGLMRIRLNNEWSRYLEKQDALHNTKS